MNVYEVRILGETSGKGGIVLQAQYLSDVAAVRAAKKLADGRPFEVWRGIQCVYAATPAMYLNPANDTWKPC